MFFIFLPVAHAQAATGQYPLGTFDALGADTINVGNLYVMLNVPVVHKPGRANTNFNYDLEYNGSIWTPSTTWTPNQNWGWLGQTATVTGYMTHFQQSGTCISGGLRQPWSSTKNVVYWDAAGLAHRWTGSIIFSDGECTGDIDTLTNTWSEDGRYQYIDRVSLADKRGNLVSPPVATMVGAGTYKDSNGNLISTDGSGHFTDTTGNVALTIAGTAPSNQRYTYTDASGTSRAVTIAFRNYSVATKFGCTRVTEYTGSSIPLVDTITMPDLRLTTSPTKQRLPSPEV